MKLSAERVAGPPHPGKKGGQIGWHGHEQGRVCLKERNLRVATPRLRKEGQGEDGALPIPAYKAMHRDEGLGARMLEVLLRGVSTRQYRAVLPEIVETVDVSRSSVRRWERIQDLAPRRRSVFSMPSKMPLTNSTESSPEKRRAISSASLITAAGGVSG